MMEMEDVLGMLKDAYEEGFLDAAYYSDTDLSDLMEENWNNSSTKHMLQEWNK